MRLLVVHPMPSARPVPLLHPVLACGALVAVLDLGLAVAWWRMEGVAATRTLQAIAEWVMGPAAYAGGSATAFAGALLYGVLMCALAALYRVLARAFPLLLRRPVLCGALYGIAMYLLVFGVAVPALIGRPAFSPPHWMAVCALAYMFLIGVPCAWFARLPASRQAR